MTQPSSRSTAAPWWGLLGWRPKFLRRGSGLLSQWRSRVRDARRRRFLRMESLEERALLATVSKFDFDSGASETGPAGWTHLNVPNTTVTDAVTGIGVRFTSSDVGFSQTYTPATIPSDASGIRNGIGSPTGTNSLSLAVFGLNSQKSYELWVLGGNNVLSSTKSQVISVSGLQNSPTVTQTINTANVWVNGSLGSNTKALTASTPILVGSPFLDGDHGDYEISVSVSESTGNSIAQLAGVVIQEAPSSFTLPATGTYTVAIQNGNRVIKDSGGNVLTGLAPSGAITITGSGAAGATTLNVDLSGGNPLTGGLTFSGTSGQSNTLNISGSNNEGAVTYNYTNAHDGSVVLGNFGTINYTALTPISNNGLGGDATFNLPAGSAATLSDNTTAHTLTLSGTGFESTTFANPTGTLTIHPGDATSTIDVGGGNVLSDLTAPVTLGSSSASDQFGSISFTGSVGLASGNSLSANATGTINIAASLTMNGTGGVSLTTAKNIVVGVGSSTIVTASGPISLSANQGSPTTGDFIGIDVNGGVKSTSGDITLAGTGGTVGNVQPQVGVYVESTGAIGGISSGTGTTGKVTITGKGGATAAGSLGKNVGVLVDGTTVTSGGGNVTITGTGGTDADDKGGDHGVYVVNDGVISAGGTGTLNVTGTGAVSALGSRNFGIDVSSASVIALSTSSGKMTLNGTGDTGVQVDGPILPGTDIDVTGTPVISGAFGIEVTAQGSINTANSGNIKLISDGIDLHNTVDAGAGHSVTVLTKSTGKAISIGGGDTAGQLGLSSTELTFLNGGTLNIGDSNSGNVNFIDNIIRSSATAVNVTSGGSINFSSGSIDTAGGNLTLTPGASAAATFAKAGTDINVGAGTASFASGASASFAITGATTPDTDYEQLNVSGNVNLTGAAIAVTGGYTPVAGNSFTVVKYTGSRTGTFSNSTVTLHGVTLNVVYDDANKQVLLSAPGTGTLSATLSGSDLTIADTAAKDNSLTISTSSGNLVISDGNEAFISAPAGGSLSPDSKTLTIPLTSVSGSLTINANGGNDAVTVLSAPALTSSLTINGGTGNDIVGLSSNFTLASGKSLDVNLQDDDPSPGFDQIIVGTGAVMNVTGSGTATLKASGFVRFGDSSGLSTASGSLTIEANQQASHSSGNFVGVDVNHATISSASGSVTVKGWGGDAAGGSQYGVLVEAGGSISGGSGNATTTIVGTGGVSTGSTNLGVDVTDSGSLITSAGGAVSVTGQGGGTGTNSGGNHGINLFGGQIKAGGSGTVTVQANGGIGAGSYGVEMAGATITSSGGAVSVTGNAGTSTGGFNLRGVDINSNGVISAGGSGSVSVMGTGGPGSGGGNVGVLLNGNPATITSSGGSITVTGVEGASSGSNAIILNPNTSIASTNNAAVTLIGNSLQVNTGGSPAATVSAGTGTVTIEPLTTGVAMDLGSTTDPVGGPLGISNAELNRITAGTIQLGADGSANFPGTLTGAITVSAAISTAAGSTTAINLTTASGNNITFGGTGSLDAKSGNVTLLTNSSGSGAITIPSIAAVDISAASVSLTAGSGGIGIGGHSLVIAATNLNSTTGGNGSQFLSASGSTTIDNTGLSAGTGTIELDGGTFTLGGSDRISNSTTLNINNGAAFAMGANNETVGGLTLTSGSITGSGTLTSGSTIITVSGSISAILAGSVGLTENGFGTTTLSGANTYTGNTTITSGTLKLGASNVIPDGAGNGDLLFNPTSGNTATLDLGGFSDTVNGLSNSGAGSSVVDNTATGGPFTFTIGGNNSSGAFGGMIQNTAGSLALTKIGTGTQTLSGANTYSGDTTISNGTLKLGASNVIPDGSGNGNVTLNPTSGNTATLDLNGFNETVNGLFGGGGGSAIVDNTAAGGPFTFTVGNNNALGIFTGVIQNTAGTLALTKIGVGTLTLNGTNTYSGDTTLSNGTLKLGANNAIPGGAGKGNVIFNPSILNSASLVLAGFNDTINGLSNPGAGTSTIDNGASGTTGILSVGDNDQTSVFSGLVQDFTGTLALTKVGAGTFTLAGGNTYSGTTTISSGTLQIGNGGSTGSLGTGSIVDNGTLVFDRTTQYSLGAISGSGGLTILTGQLNLAGANTYTGTTLISAGSLFLTTTTGSLSPSSAIIDNGVFGSQRSNTITQGVDFASVISGSGSVTQAGATGGKLVLNGLNTYTGSTIVNGGTIAFNSVKNVGGGPSALGAPTSVANGTIKVGAIGFSAPSTLSYIGTGDTTDRVIDLAANAGGSATLDQSGAGLLKFTSAFTATGASAKTFTLQGSTAGTGEVAGAIVDNSATNTTSVTKAGTGAWTLSGANTYTGATAVNAGTLLVNGTGSITSNVTVNSGGTLGGTGTINSANSVTVNSGGHLAPGSATPGVLHSGSLTLSSGANFDVGINSTIQFAEQFVTGTASLGGATLNVTLGGTPAPGNAFNIVHGASTLTGTLKLPDGTSLPEGKVFSVTTGSFTATFQISYQGNDVLLTALNAANPTLSGTTGNDNFLAKINSGTGNLEISLNGNVILSTPPSSLNGLTINGSTGTDSLTLDYSNGSPFPAGSPGGIAYHAGNNAGDKVVIVGTFDTITNDYTTTGPGKSGDIKLTKGSQTDTILYDGIAPIDMTGTTVGNLVFNLPGSGTTANQAFLEDDGASNTISQLRSGNSLFDLTTFANPSGSVTINRGGGTANTADTIQINSLPDLTASLTFGQSTAQFSSVTFAGAVSLAANNSLSSFGATTTVNGSLTTAGGSIALAATGDIGVNNSLVSGGGPITLTADSDANGSGTVTLAAWVLQQQVTALGGAAGDQFGFAVALSSDGNTAILGAPHDDVLANADQGTAMVFTRTGSVWTQQQQLTAGDGAAGDQFGFAVALSSDGNTAIVGTFGDDVNGNVDQGSVYVFTRSGSVWTQQQQLTATGGLAGDFFGNAVALSSDGNTAIVGAYKDDVGLNTDQGTATVFTRSGGVWTQQQQITATGGAAGDAFGTSVALSSDGNTAIVGAYLDDATATDQGTATVFTRSGSVWTQQAQLTAPSPAVGDNFGISVTLSSDGNTAVIGAENDDVGANVNQGSATLFTRNGTTWTQQQQLTAVGGAANDGFGNSVALSGDGNTLIVTANADDVGANVDQGSAYVFSRFGTTFVQQQQLTDAGGAASDFFGIAAALSSDGKTAVVGAYLDDVGANADQGSADVITNGVSIAAGGGNVTITGASADIRGSISTTSTGAISATTTAGISLAPGANVSAVNGNVTLSANQQTPATAAAFVGINISGATITTTGSGSINLLGTAGTTSGVGIIVQNGAVLSSTAATSAGAINITGTGSSSAVSGDEGLLLQGATTDINSVGGNINITGASAATSGVSQHGILQNPGEKIRITGTGSLTMRGLTATTSSLVGVGMRLLGAITLSGSQNSLISDKMTLVTGAGNFSLTATGAVTLKPSTAGKSIDLGSTVDSNTPLELSVAELKLIAAATINVGDTTTGNINVTDGITRTGALSSSVNMSLATNSSSSINFVTGTSSGSINTGGGNLLLSPGSAGVTIQETGSLPTTVTVGSTGTLSFTSGTNLNIQINGTSAGHSGGYDQLSVNGNVDLTGVNLVLSGTYTPQAKNHDLFAIVNNVADTNPKGTTTPPFNGRAEGSIFKPNVGSLTTDLQITYKGVDGASNDVVLFAANHAPTLSGANNFTTITEDDFDLNNDNGDLVSTLINNKFNDPDGGVLSGIAVTGFNSSTGTWRYSLDNGGTWTTLGTVSTSSALLLRSVDKLQFIPDSKNGTTASVTFVGWDQFSGNFGTTVDVSTRGGNTPYSTATGASSITVTSVNDAPVLSGANNFTAITEDDVNGSGDLISTLINNQVTDVDNGFVTGIAVTGLTSGTGNWQFSIDNGTNWTDVGTVSDATALLLRSIDRLRLVPDLKNGTAGSVTFLAWDQSSGTQGTTADTTINGGTTAFSSSKATSNITVNSLNDAPVLNGANNFTTIPEDNATGGGDLVSTLISGQISDVDASPIQGIAVTATNNSTGKWQFSTDNGQSWSDVGTVSASSALLLRPEDKLRFVPDGKNGTTASVTFAAWDQTSGTAGQTGDASTPGGTSAFSIATATSNITVRNDAPVLSGANDFTAITEDDQQNSGDLISTLINGKVSDVNFGAQNGIAVTGTISGTGTWQFSTDNGQNWSAVSGVSLTSALLLRPIDKLRLVPDGNNGTTGSVTFVAWDQATGAAGGTADVSTRGGTTAFSTATATSGITVTNVNDAPLLAGANGFTTITEDQTTNGGDAVSALVNNQITDVDSGASQGIAVTGINSSTGTWQFSIDNGQNWAAVGAVTTSAALLLRPEDKLRFVPDSKNGTTASVTFVAWDQTSGSAGELVATSPAGGISAFSNASGTSAITVTNVNDAPQIIDGDTTGLTDTNEDTPSVGAAVSAILNQTGWSDVDQGALQGIAVTGQAGNGVWQYSTDSTTWTAFGTVSANHALLLTGDTEVRYQPDGKNGELASFTFVAWDRTSDTASIDTAPSYANPGAGGGTSAYSTQSATAWLGVTDVNDAPVLSGAHDFTTITEDDLNNTGNLVSDLIAGQISDVDNGTFQGIAVTSLDSGNGSWQFSTDAGMTWNAVGDVSSTSALLLIPDNLLRFVPSGVIGTTASITFEAWDTSDGNLAGDKVDASATGGSNPFSSATATSSITVTSANDPPVFTAGPSQKVTDEGVASARSVTFGGLTGDDTTPFTSYSENGFSVTVTDGQWTELHTGAGINGNPAPAIEGGATGTIVVTRPGGLFSFNSVDVAPIVAAGPPFTLKYTVVGQLNGHTVFFTSAQNGNQGFSTIQGSTRDLIDSVRITVSLVGASNFAVDNIRLTVPSQTIDGWATNIAGGPAGATDEMGQTVGFIVTVLDHPEIFTDKPQIDAAGRLSFTPKPNSAGIAHISIVAMDNGGTDNGGKDTSDPQIFTIEVDKAHVYHNTLNRLDVDNDGHVVPKDLVALISYLNGFGASSVPGDGRPTGPYVDIDGDGTAAPKDLTLLISYLNGFGADGEGEGSQASGVAVQTSAEGEAAADAALPSLASSPAATPMANQPVQDDVLALLAADVASQPKRRV